ncbi:MAG: hypothetical protein JWN95_1347 [Frankiales bacterium]|nr:hypothetical protein [Frankiales bacterium]
MPRAMTTGYMQGLGNVLAPDLFLVGPQGLPPAARYPVEASERVPAFLLHLFRPRHGDAQPVRIRGHGG